MLTRVQLPPSLLRSSADVVRELNGWADGPLMDSVLMFWACCLLVVSGLRNMLSGLGPFSLIKNYPDGKKKKNTTALNHILNLLVASLVRTFLSFWYIRLQLLQHDLLSLGTYPPARAPHATYHVAGT